MFETIGGIKSATFDLLSFKMTNSPATHTPDQDGRYVFVLGMPSLTISGLSENWLLKTCGDVHWRSICQACGRASHQIGDANGNRLYPSFVQIVIRGDSLSSFAENDWITIEPIVRKVSSRRVWSKQTLRNERGSGELSVEMMTIFMRRLDPKGSNTRLESGETDFVLSMPKYEPRRDGGEIIGQMRTSEMDDASQDDEQQLLSSAFASLNTFSYRPCPTVEFNGAQLLYFANYQEIIDRAEWVHFDYWPLESYATSLRDIRYLGNIDSRDTVKVRFVSAEMRNDSICHKAIITRASDEKIIAQSDTEKRLRHLRS